MRAAAAVRGQCHRRSEAYIHVMWTSEIPGGTAVVIEPLALIPEAKHTQLRQGRNPQQVSQKRHYQSQRQQRPKYQV